MNRDAHKSSVFDLGNNGCPEDRDNDIYETMEGGRASMINPTNFEKSPPGRFWKGQGAKVDTGVDPGGIVPNVYPPPKLCEGYQEYNFTSKISLATFVHQTLNYVIAQLFMTVSITGLAYGYKDSVNNYIQNHSGILWIPMIMSFITLIMLYCSSDIFMKKTMFWLFTLACSSLVAVSTIQYAPMVIMNALITLFLIVILVNVYAYYTAKNDKDFSFMGPSLFGCLGIIIIMNIINIFLKITFLGMVIGVLSVIVFTAMLLYDLNRLYIGVDQGDDILAQPILAAINIYLDIINIFLNLLRLFGGND
jgi:FtsH-binding integral membrane protein